MNHKRYIVDLSEEERTQLLELIKKGKASARKIARAHILLSADRGDSDKAIAQALHVSVPTVQRTRKRFAEGRLERAVNERPRPGARRRLDGKQEAFLIALACSRAPEGHEHWTVRLLADRLVQLEVADEVSRETVRRVLKGGRSNPG
jgi:transposase